MTILPNLSSSVKYQYLATVIVNLTSLLYGFASGWTSSSLLILESAEKSPLVQGAMDQEERSWVTSLFAISGVVGTLIYYLSADFFGRKYPLLSLAVPHCISWILIEYGIHPWQLYLSRILSGLASGGTFTLVPVFVAEISESHVRGRLGSILMLSANAGFLIAFVAGYSLEYFTIPYIGIVVSIIAGTFFIYFPETQVYLLRRNNEQDAEKSFRFYRNIAYTGKMPETYAKEWDDLKKRVEESNAKQKETKINFSELFKTRAGRKAFVIGIAMILMHELCGCFTMLNYTAVIFRESGSSISPELSAIIVGFIQLLGTYCATLLVDRFGRKILLVFSATGTSLCLFCLGAYSYSNSIGIDVKPYSWISITSFSGMMFLAACGIIPLMFIVIAEVMPENVRSVGCTICFCLSWVLAFVMVKFFEAVALIFGMHGWVLFFAVCTLLGTFFIIFKIPETKGRSYAEIAAILNE